MAFPAHLAIMFSAIALLGGKGRRIPYITERGANSIVNYVFHYLLVLGCGALGLYENYSLARLVAAISIGAVAAQVWMAPPVASVLKKFLVPRPLLHLVLLAESTA